MPVMDGYEALKEIRDIERLRGDDYTYIIALSGNASSEDKQKSLSLGMDYQIAKPYSASEIRKIIEQVALQNNDLMDEEEVEMVEKKCSYSQIYTDEDMQMVLEKVDYDVDFLEVLINKFEVSYRKILDKIRQSRLDNDCVTLKLNIHSLKGELLIFNASYLLENICLLEKMANNNQCDYHNDIFAKLEDDIQELIQNLNLFVEARKQLACEA